MNIMFKRGPQANLNTIISSGKSDAGCFYLTTDTNRLYVGQDANKAPVLLNQTVQIVANVNSLPTIGADNGPAVNDFYYCVQENILAVYTGGTEWKQINANTDRDVYVNSAAATVTKDNDSIDVAVELKRKNKNYTTNEETNASSVNFAFSFTKEDLSNLLGIDVGLDVTAISGGGAKISAIGTGSDGDNIVNIKAADASVQVSVSGDDVKIKGTTYDLQATGDKLILKNALSNNTDDAITLEDDGIVNITGDNDKITVTHKAYTASETAGSAANGTLASDGTGKFKVVNGISTEQGHVTGYTTQEYTLPAYHNTTNKTAAINANNAGDLTMSVTDTDNNKVEAKAEKVLYYKLNGSNVYNQGTLDVYTKGQVDAKFNAVNAMVYKGTVGGAEATVSSLPTSNVSVGDTYKVAASGNYGGHACGIGDLLIATGTETNGVISSGLTWTYVPSGDDTDTHYDLSAANNQVILSATNGGNEEEAVTFQSADESIAIETLAGDIINIEHALVDCDVATSENIKPTHSGNAFDIIKDIEVNEHGHVIAYTPAKVTLPADNDTKYDISVVAGTANKSAQIKLHGTDNSNDTVTLQNSDGYVTVNKDATTDTITLNHKSYGTLSATTQDDTDLGYESNFTVVTGVSRDSGGHISGYTTKKFTLPGDTNETFTLSGASVAVANNAATFTTSLEGSKNTDSNATMVVKSSSTNVSITASGTNGASIDLVWGTF